MPRLFRYPEQRALINRMGFNSDGLTAVLARLRALNWDHDRVPLGINVGKNRATSEQQAVEDYVQAVEAFYPHARYIVVNVSSPNTQGLRDLASREFLEYLAERLPGKQAKIWIKFDPDMPKRRLQEVVEKAVDEGFAGIILTNTHRVEWPERGGLSGHPLAVMSAAALEHAYEVHRGRLPMIASGGILTGADIFERLARGAHAAQIYTALIYRGPWVIEALLAELVAEMRLRGYSVVGDVIGSYYQN